MPKVQEKIEALIAARGLAPGARLPAERVLAAELGVSRAKLREAIQALASRGRLSSLRGSGTFVATGAPPLSGALAPLASLAAHEPGYWQDVMEIRKSLDADMAFYAALRATPADRDHLSRALAALDAAEGAPPAVQGRADAAFHMAIAQASHNAVMRQVMAGLFDLLRQSISESLDKLYTLPAGAGALSRQHHQIADAIFDGRADDARAAAAAHLVFVEDSLRRIEDAAARERRSALPFPPSHEQNPRGTGRADAAGMKG